MLRSLRRVLTCVLFFFRAHVRLDRRRQFVGRRPPQAGQRDSGRPAALVDDDERRGAGQRWPAVAVLADQAKNVERFRQEAPRQSLVKMRGDLQREFGSAFEVSAAGQYLVVHPRGHGGEWSQHFDEL